MEHFLKSQSPIIMDEIYSNFILTIVQFSLLNSILGVFFIMAG